MAKTPTDSLTDADLDPARRVMQRLANTPPKPHKGPEKGNAKKARSAARTGKVGPLRRLPASKWILKKHASAPGFVFVGAHARQGRVHFTKVRRSDLPHDLTANDVLERVVINPVDRRSVV